MIANHVIVEPLKFIQTSEGTLFPIYRNWDAWHHGHEPKMVYATTILPGVRKDIILHERRTAMITAIQGNVKLRCRLPNSHLIYEVWLRNEDTEESNVVKIEPGIPIELINDSKNTAIVINAPNPSWHPDDPDTIKFKTWEEYDAHIEKELRNEQT